MTDATPPRHSGPAPGAPTAPLDPAAVHLPTLRFECLKAALSTPGITFEGNYDLVQTADAFARYVQTGELPPAVKKR